MGFEQVLVVLGAYDGQEYDESHKLEPQVPVLSRKPIAPKF